MRKNTEGHMKNAVAALVSAALPVSLRYPKGLRDVRPPARFLPRLSTQGALQSPKPLRPTSHRTLNSGELPEVAGPHPLRSARSRACRTLLQGAPDDASSCQQNTKLLHVPSVTPCPSAPPLACGGSGGPPLQIPPTGTAQLRRPTLCPGSSRGAPRQSPPPRRSA